MAAPGILGERLSAGRTAEIYRWSETEVIKLYQPWVSRETVERERSNTRAAWEMDLPAPRAGDIRAPAGRTELILERIQGHTMMSLLEGCPSCSQTGPVSTRSSKAVFYGVDQVLNWLTEFGFDDPEICQTISGDPGQMNAVELVKDGHWGRGFRGDRSRHCERIKMISCMGS